MKKFFYRFFFMVILLTIGSVGLLIYTTTPLLDPLTQQAHKEGKNFWEWNSPYGPLAVHYTEQGEGTDHLLLIHGFRSRTFTWRHIAKPLADAGYHVWAIDLIGFGLSDKPPHASYDVDFFVQQIKSFMDAKNISSAHLIGNSMGGGLALHLALDHPQNVRSLTLISALGYPLDLPVYLSIIRHLGPIWAPLLGPTMIRTGLKQIVFDPATVSEEQVEAYSLPYRFPGGATASLQTLKQFDKQKLVDLSKRYPAIDHPLLVIWGDHDTLIPVQHYEQFISDFPAAERLLITDCGHIPQEENPTLVVDAILKFLKHQIPFEQDVKEDLLLTER